MRCSGQSCAQGAAEGTRPSIPDTHDEANVLQAVGHLGDAGVQVQQRPEEIPIVLRHSAQWSKGVKIFHTVENLT